MGKLQGIDAELREEYGAGSRQIAGDGGEHSRWLWSCLVWWGLKVKRMKFYSIWQAVVSCVRIERNNI